MLIFVSAIEVQKKSFLRYFCRKLSSVDWSGTNLCGWMQKEENKDFPRSKSSKWFKFKNNISLRLKLSQRGKWDPRHISFFPRNSQQIFFLIFQASVKNFQLCHHSSPDYIIMQVDCHRFYHHFKFITSSSAS